MDWLAPIRSAADCIVLPSDFYLAIASCDFLFVLLRDEAGGAVRRQVHHTFQSIQFFLKKRDLLLEDCNLLGELGIRGLGQG